MRSLVVFRTPGLHCICIVCAYSMCVSYSYCVLHSWASGVKGSGIEGFCAKGVWCKV